MRVFLVCLSLALACRGGAARVFNPASLARELYSLGFPISELNDWNCLINGESSYDTEAMNYSNTDGSYDWGLFQINDMYWCGSKGAANGCNIRCEELVKSDISAAARCAQKVKKETARMHGGSGFSAWVAWNNRCKGRQLEDVTQYVQCGDGRRW